MSQDKNWKECRDPGFERDVQVVCKLHPTSVSERGGGYVLNLDK